MTGNPQTFQCPDCQVLWSREPLTERQLAVLRFVAGEIHQKALAPTIAEIEQAFDLTAQTIHELLTRLEGKRYIKRERFKPRAITLIEPVP